MGGAALKRTSVRLSNQLNGQQVVHVVDALRLARMGDLEIDLRDVEPLRPIHLEILAAIVLAWRADGYLLTFIYPTSEVIDGHGAMGGQAPAPTTTVDASMRLNR